MNALNALLDEVVGMFVDDGSLAIAILAIVAVAGWVSMRFENASSVVGAILILGCLAALIENVVRTTRKAGR
jgi:hypothetical protein